MEQTEETKKSFSLYWEIQATLYLGVFFLLAGLGLTIKKHFADLGHPLIIGSLTLGFLMSFYYCFKKGESYTSEKWTPPQLLFPYILYLGCVVLSLDLIYIETHFHLLGSWWETYLLVSGLFFGFLAYRFDNRLSLGFGLTTLATWFGLTLNQFHLNFNQFYRPYALAYGMVVIGIGVLFTKNNIKKHFLDTYLHFGLNVLFVALVSGTFEYKTISLYFLALIFLSGLSLYWGFRKTQFIYVVYGLFYGYIGVSSVFTGQLHSVKAIFLYFVVSSISVLITVVWLARKFKEKS